MGCHVCAGAMHGQPVWPEAREVHRHAGRHAGLGLLPGPAGRCSFRAPHERNVHGWLHPCVCGASLCHHAPAWRRGLPQDRALLQHHGVPLLADAGMHIACLLLESWTCGRTHTSGCLLAGDLPWEPWSVIAKSKNGTCQCSHVRGAITAPVLQTSFLGSIEPGFGPGSKRLNWIAGFPVGHPPNSAGEPPAELLVLGPGC